MLRRLRDGHASGEEALSYLHHAADLGGALRIVLPLHHAPPRGVDGGVAVEEAGLGHAHPIEGDPGSETGGVGVGWGLEGGRRGVAGVAGGELRCVGCGGA